MRNFNVPVSYCAVSIHARKHWFCQNNYFITKKHNAKTQHGFEIVVTNRKKYLKFQNNLAKKKK